MSTLTYTWDSSTSDQPADGDSPRYADDKIRETRNLVEERLGREHLLQAGGVFDTNNNQGYHRPGSAMAYLQAAAPTNLPDDQDALADDVLSKGRLWVDSDDDIMYYWNGTAWTVIGGGTLARITGLNSSDLEAWHASWGALEAYDSAIVYGVSNKELDVVSNAYYDGTWKYKKTGAAGLIVISGTTISFTTAASGAADSAITWTTVGAFDANFQFTLNKGQVPAGSYNNASTHTYGDIYTALAADLPDGGSMLVTGGLVLATGRVLIAANASRSGTDITLYAMDTVASLVSVTISSGSATSVSRSALAW